MDDNGTKESYTVRIANNSNYDCTLDSKTACGFVVEFVDIIEKRGMNSTDTNVGGWPATAMYKYLNGTYDSNAKTWNRTDTLYSKLPSDLQDVIIDTTVVSGHGLRDSNSVREDRNWDSIDKLYLLCPKEIWLDGIDRDSANENTRQLDYYEIIGVTMINYSGAIKNLNDSTDYWWLRGTNQTTDNTFFAVYPSGGVVNGNSKGDRGLAPAFRIG